MISQDTKRVVRMWLIHDTLFLHEQSAIDTEDGKDTVREVYVGVDNELTTIELVDGESSEYYGSWIFQDKATAYSEVNDYNYG